MTATVREAMWCWRWPTRKQVQLQREQSQNHTKAPQDDLEAIKSALGSWLADNETPTNLGEKTAEELLTIVFTSHHSLREKVNALSGKIQRRDERLKHHAQQLENAAKEKTSRDNENLRLRQKVAHMEEQIKLEKQAREDLVQQYNTQLKDLREKHSGEVQHITSNYDIQLHQQRRKHETDICELNNRYDRELDAMIQSHIRQTDENQQNHEIEIRKERMKVQKAEADMRMCVDNFQALQDATLEDRQYQLRTGVETLSRLRFPIDIPQLATLGSTYQVPQDMPQKNHRLLLQSTLWAIILDGVFRSPFRVFGVYGDTLHESWQSLFGSSGSHYGDGQAPNWPSADDLTEKWRYTTIDRLRRALKSEETEGQEREIQASYYDNMSQVSSRLANLLAPVWSQEVEARVRRVVGQACAFALDIAVERCRVQVFMPKLGGRVLRESADVKDVYVGSEKEIPYGTAHFAVSPGLSKEGNSRGGNLHERTVISKAVVYFSLESDTGLAGY